MFGLKCVLERSTSVSVLLKLMLVENCDYMNIGKILISVINQLDAQKFCFTISLFHACTCFEHMCLSSGGQNCITHSLVSSHL